MFIRLRLRTEWPRTRRFVLGLTIQVACVSMTISTVGQTSSTGALAGIASDASGAVLPGVTIRLSRDNQGETRLATSDEEGRFGFLFLLPGTYHLDAEKNDFEHLSLPDLHISTTEIL